MHLQLCFVALHISNDESTRQNDMPVTKPGTTVLVSGILDSPEKEYQMSEISKLTVMSINLLFNHHN